ncbi:nitrilase-related carbon-nitrogen hydrolase [Candidatus Berkiella aquae]|uniref:Carbon-nitrogen hydrolase n=1 Tax=Candidatus Berkiella aquae TaxID=295108 RepID=A0A0Q9Z0L5_9GAMM|nr:carbon-nitrogen hydrolase [Candidatus Berkiella aquae]MCS5711804.1 carbon-nitrogen hydrolase [Candidatus Berkiella aquae]
MVENKTLRVGIVQDLGYQTPQQSYDSIEKHLRDCKQQGVQCVLLQELHSHLYFPQTETVDHFDLAETIPGPTTDFLCRLAKELQLVIVSSIFEKRAPGLYHNTAVVIEKNGEIAGLYRKMHIPDDPGFFEKFYFTPGDLGFTPIDTSVGSLGVLVCWDQWFPEAARLMALQGADVLLYPTAIGWSDEDNQAEQQRQRDAWITVQRGHAVANGLPVLVANRVGTEENTLFWGSSFIAAQQGEILSQANQNDKTVLVADLSLTRTEHVRRIWPFLRDRRIDAYSDLTKRFLK